MSEYEYIDAMSTFRDSAGFHAMNYIAVLFAYLVAGFFAANILSRFQVIAATVLYLILCPAPGIATYEAAVEHSRLAAQYYAKYRPDEHIPLWDVYLADAWLFAFPATLLLSIIFMVQSSRSGRNNEAT
jgi:hypothetical protein